MIRTASLSAILQHSVSDIFIRGIDSIIEVLKLVEELIDRYKDARISADIDNT